MLSPRKTVFAAIVFFGAFFAGHAIAQEKSIVVASTTSTQDSGLFDCLLPLFTQKTGIAVQGMDAALQMAVASNAYVLSDRATWIHLKNRGDLQILVEGDKRMFNQYGVILVNPTSEREARIRSAVHQLASIAGRPESHRQLQDRRRAVIRSKRNGSRRVI